MSDKPGSGADIMNRAHNAMVARASELLKALYVTTTRTVRSLSDEEVYYVLYTAQMMSHDEDAKTATRRWWKSMLTRFRKIENNRIAKKMAKEK